MLRVALGQARRAVGDRVVPIRDWHPDFAFTHVLHFVTEALGHLPTYQGFRDFTRNDPIGRAMLYSPAEDAIAAATAAGYSRPDAAEAMRWRIGNAYYSFVREVHVLAYLRHHGIDVRVHPLADALFRADAWTGDTVVSLYVGNEKFRQGTQGRKPPAHSVLSDALPPFDFLSLELPTVRRFGVVHLAAEERLAAAVAKLRSTT